MKPTHVCIAFTLAACTPTDYPLDERPVTSDVVAGESDVDAATPPDLAADVLSQCCDCERGVCVPATSVLDCEAGEEWCWLDQDGNPSDCWKKCDPLGTCCDCVEIECRNVHEAQCNGFWERWCALGDAVNCYAQCVPPSGPAVNLDHPDDATSQP